MAHLPSLWPSFASFNHDMQSLLPHTCQRSDLLRYHLSHLPQAFFSSPNNTSHTTEQSLLARQILLINIQAILSTSAPFSHNRHKLLQNGQAKAFQRGPDELEAKHKHLGPGKDQVLQVLEGQEPACFREEPS